MLFFFSLDKIKNVLTRSGKKSYVFLTKDIKFIFCKNLRKIFNAFTDLRFQSVSYDNLKKFSAVISLKFKKFFENLMQERIKKIFQGLKVSTKKRFY